MAEIVLWGSQFEDCWSDWQNFTLTPHKPIRLFVQVFSPSQNSSFTNISRCLWPGNYGRCLRKIFIIIYYVGTNVTDYILSPIYYHRYSLSVLYDLLCYDCYQCSFEEHTIHSNVKCNSMGWGVFSKKKMIGSKFIYPSTTFLMNNCYLHFTVLGSMRCTKISQWNYP